MKKKQQDKTESNSSEDNEPDKGMEMLANIIVTAIIVYGLLFYGVCILIEVCK